MGERPLVKNWGQGSIYLRGRTWWISYPFRGQQIKESAKTADPAVARRLLRKRVQAVTKNEFGGVVADRVLVDELLDDLLTDYRINGKSYNWAELVVRCHLRPAFGYHRAAQIGTDLIQQYISARRCKPIANSTINRELALLRRAFNLGARAEPPKVARVPHIPTLEEHNVRQGFFTHEEFWRMYILLPTDVQPVVLFAYYTGCRKSEILGLRWSQFDADRRVVRLEAGETKNDEPRTVPLTDDLFQALCALKRERDENWPWAPRIFTRLGTPIKDFHAAWDSACERAGLTGRLFHDLRRTGVRNLVRAGVPETVAMRISGHKTRSVFDRYNIVSEDDLREAADKLGRYTGGARCLVPEDTLAGA